MHSCACADERALPGLALAEAKVPVSPAALSSLTPSTWSWLEHSVRGGRDTDAARAIAAAVVFEYCDIYAIARHEERTRHCLCGISVRNDCLRRRSNSVSQWQSVPETTHQHLKYELNRWRLLHPWRLLQQRLLRSGRCEYDKGPTQGAQAHNARVGIFVLGRTFKDAVALPSSIRRQAWIARLYTTHTG